MYQSSLSKDFMGSSISMDREVVAVNPEIEWQNDINLFDNLNQSE